MNLIHAKFFVNALCGSGLMQQAGARAAFQRRSNWPGYEAAAAIRADIVQDVIDAISAEGALVATDTRFARIRW